MTIAACKLCPWNVDFAQGDAAAQRGLEKHIELRHPAAIPAEPVAFPAEDWKIRPSAHNDWWARAIDTIASQPAGSTFTLYEVCAQLDEPPSSNGWQKLARDAHHLGLVEPAGGVPSKRPGTRRSMTTLWRRTHLNPVRERRTG